MKEFLRNKTILAGVFMMAFYQVIMIGIFMWGYSAVPRNISEMTAAIVNEDQQTGQQLVTQLESNLPFKLVTDLSLSEAQTQLNNRDIQLIVHVPADFTTGLTTQGAQAKLDFFINQSNPQTAVSTMQNVVNRISDQFIVQTQTQSFTKLLEQFRMPEDQAAQTVNGVMNKVVSNVVTTNTPPAGLHNQMAPMFLSMASYVGSMIYAMMSVTALNQTKPKLGKLRAFLSLQGVNVLLSLIVPLIGVSIYFGIQGYGAEAFFKTWMTHSFEMFAAIQFTSIACMLLGQAGMILNMPLVLIQSLVCGATIPREMLPGFFQFMSRISPMYYSVHIDYNVLFGGGNTSAYLVGLALVAGGALLINIVIHAFKPLKARREAAASLLPSM
ncbi:ABC transporter permease [Saccharibacillus sp. CPCC 101409]|uniref:YhgE/Pip domain-containing protein n=1 Tax=Saccharibacillus sp. CPCC 101409 TaxID=3058041 RepID=UPI002672CB6A|nr:ABC transporter permease [Saccharibacillus sp. CPCC 101409]MDO3412624.1 ABC transporter permease [Saccharibacillus sp. CPCC 101409]